MSDIQRYVVEDEVALADNYDNEGLLKLTYLSAVVVKYDDYIEEIERLVAVVQQFINNPESKAARQAVINALNYYKLEKNNE